MYIMQYTDYTNENDFDALTDRQPIIGSESQTMTHRLWLVGYDSCVMTHER